jgi:hypothetical protein
MKVICIDGSKRSYSEKDGQDVKEGVIYEVTDSWNGIFTNQPYYSLAGFDCIKRFKGFRQDRFAPLSDINETEFERNYQKELV